jgi:hypothetical protein
MAEQQKHPIGPPLWDLMHTWEHEWTESKSNDVPFNLHMATRAAQWGADQELEAIQKEIIKQAWFADPRQRLAQLRAARRPKPPSLKERAIGILKHRELHRDTVLNPQDANTILRALELLPDD